MEVVIPPKKNRKEQRAYDKALYKIRHLVENAFLHFKALARDSYTICEKLSILPCRHTD